MLLARATLLVIAPPIVVAATVLAATVLTSPLPVSAQDAPVTTPSASDQPPAGLAADEEARMRFELGRRYYDTGRFEDAIREFVEAHRLSGRAELLYNLFLAYRDAGDDPHAAETLRAYIPSLEPGERRTQLEARLRVLEQRLAGGGAATGGGTSGDSATGSDTGIATGSDPGTGSGTEMGTGTGTGAGAGTSAGASGGGLGVVPWVIVGVGGALVLGSVITGVMALDARSTLDRTCGAGGACPPGYEGTQSSGQALAITTDILWVTGAIAVGTGVVLAIVDLGSSTASAESTSVGGACTGDGCFFGVRGRF